MKNRNERILYSDPLARLRNDSDNALRKIFKKFGLAYKDRWSGLGAYCLAHPWTHGELRQLLRVTEKTTPPRMLVYIIGSGYGSQALEVGFHLSEPMDCEVRLADFGLLEWTPERREWLEKHGLVFEDQKIWDEYNEMMKKAKEK